MDARLRLNAIRSSRNRKKSNLKRLNNYNSQRNRRTQTQSVTDLRQLISNSNQNTCKQTVGLRAKSESNNKNMVSKRQLSSNGVNGAKRTRNTTRVALSSSDDRIPKVMVKLSAIKTDRSVSALTSNRVTTKHSNITAKLVKNVATNSRETAIGSDLNGQPSNALNASHITQSTRNRSADISAIVANHETVEKNCSVLISNLNPSITDDDIVVLFREVGQLLRASKINQYVAVVVYGNESDAVNACQTYHNRLLDGMPMQCRILSGKQNAYVITQRQQTPFGVSDSRALLASQIRQINASSSQPRKMTAAQAFSEATALGRRNPRDNVNFTINI